MIESGTPVNMTLTVYTYTVYRVTGVLVYDRGWYPCQYDTDSIYILYIGVQGISV